MKRWFGNISMAWKLTLGFGLVILLTLAMALSGWRSLGEVLFSTNRMNDIQQLDNAMTALRIVRLEYMVSRGDDAIAERVQKAYEHYGREHAEALASFVRPENVLLLKQQGKLLPTYAQSLEKVREAYRASLAARNDMGTHAERVLSLIGAIEADVKSIDNDDRRKFERYEAVVQARQSMTLARYEVRGYTNNTNAETERAMVDQIQAAVLKFKELSSVFGASHASEVQQALESLGAYQAAVDRFREANSANALAREALTSVGGEMIQINQQLLENQLAHLDRESGAARRLQLGVALLTLLVGTLAAWVTTRQIINPLNETLAVVERIATGDLSQAIQVNRRDEIGKLQVGVQRMGSTLRELIAGMRDGVIQIASAAEQLSAVIEQTAAEVNSQKLETDQVATAMHEMSATVQEVARNAENASQAASLADTESRQGDAVVGEVIVHIERLALEVSRSTEAMTHLQQESGKIGSVMDVIKAVAEQTNLLALNAAIEAARAGEAGRGFAVVADEVRGLAQRTQKSAEEIEGLIGSLQQGTQSVANIMASSRDLTDSSVQLSRRAGDSLDTITSTVSNIQLMNQQIAAAAEQQSAVAEEINRSIITVRDVSDQTAAASEEIAASSVELARLGTQLQTMVSHFRI